MRGTIAFTALFGFLLALWCGLLALGALLVMFLWNVVAGAFGAPEISFGVSLAGLGLLGIVASFFRSGKS